MTLTMYKNLSRKWLIGIAVGSGILALAITLLMAGLWWAAMPVFRFPQPTGPHSIGTLTYHWVDTSRADIFAADPNARRELMAQVWYPARADPTSRRAPYMQDAESVMAAFARIHGKPPFLFRQFKHVTTNAFVAARMADARSAYPVLIVPVGATGLRQMNTFQVEELVSHGYIVVAIDQPGAAADVVFPDGHEVPGVPVVELQALIRPSHIPSATSPLLQGRPLAESSIVPFLTQDVSFALDQLAVLNQADPNGVLTGRLVRGGYPSASNQHGCRVRSAARGGLLRAGARHVS